jgi:hypothetical protein
MGTTHSNLLSSGAGGAPVAGIIVLATAKRREVSSKRGQKDGATMESDNRPSSENRPSRVSPDGVVELTRVQPIEAEVIAARLRASGIPATVGAESVYPSLVFAAGVPVLVPAAAASRAQALLEEGEEPQ